MMQLDNVRAIPQPFRRLQTRILGDEDSQEAEIQSASPGLSAASVAAEASDGPTAASVVDGPQESPLKSHPQWALSLAASPPLKSPPEWPSGAESSPLAKAPKVSADQATTMVLKAIMQRQDARKDKANLFVDHMLAPSLPALPDLP